MAPLEAVPDARGIDTALDRLAQAEVASLAGRVTGSGEHVGTNDSGSSGAKGSPPRRIAEADRHRVTPRILRRRTVRECGPDPAFRWTQGESNP